MPSISRRTLTLLCLFVLPVAVHAQAPSVERVEPTFWWVGMVEPTVQFMVYGPDIATARVQLDAYPGVTLTHVTEVANPNYAFITLHIGDEAAPHTRSISTASKSESKTTRRAGT